MTIKLLKLFFSLVLISLFGLLVITKPTFAQTLSFSDNFNSSVPQPVDVYNPAYFNFETGDSDASTVYNGKVTTAQSDIYTYQGLGSLNNPCSEVTGAITVNTGLLQVF